ncbi:hypothetical protein RvY_14106 [Ramazzottius varieornatus]|uniref:Uncharacterized protein n=1 Tax=Ramazzottius varieornatus TaxID=947166 RepID=A0A1D1VQ61_RAMVA|nr:hypothetical protein RvY_14106 [Ramazzottius varieornatus]
MDLQTGRAACKTAAQWVWKKLWKSRDHADFAFFASDGTDENEKPEVAEDKGETATVDDVLAAFRRFSRSEVSSFLELMYTGESSGVDGYITAIYHLSKLLKVADVLELIQFCLRHRLQLFNGLDALVLATEVKDDSLQWGVEKYLVERR